MSERDTNAGSAAEAASTDQQRFLDSEQERMALLYETLLAAGESLDLATVLARVVRCINVALKGTHCSIFLAEPSSTSFHPRATSGDLDDGPLKAHLGRALDPSTDPILAAAISKRRPIAYSLNADRPLVGRDTCKALGISAALGLPIFVGDRVLALAVVVCANAACAFGLEETQLAMAIANAVAPAIEHARLYAESREQLAEINARQQITAAVLDRVGLKGMLELVCRETQNLIGAGGVAVLLEEAHGGMELAFRFGDAPSWAERVMREVVPPGSDPMPVEPVLISDLLADELTQDDSSAQGSLLIVPLRVHDRVIGALQVVNRHTGFKKEDLRLASAIAEQVAVAIEHARLHEQQEQMAILEERQRLARDLHDSVTQSLYGVSTLAEAAARLIDAGKVEAASEHLRELQSAALKALREMRHLIFELNPPDVEKSGLASALQSRLAAVEGRSGIKTVFSCEGVGRLPTHIEKDLYRIAQEAFNNSVRHAKASRLSLRLSQQASGVTLEIFDDGMGFDLTEGRSKGGMGLRGMEERVARLGGTLAIGTRPGHGTQIRIKVPVTSPARPSKG